MKTFQIYKDYKICVAVNKTTATLLVFFLLFVSIKSEAQYDIKRYNKLKQDLKIAKAATLRISTMLALADYHVEQSRMTGFERSKDTAYAYCKKCLNISKAIKSAKFQAYTYLLYAKASDYEGKYSKSIAFANSGLFLFEKLNDAEGRYKARQALLQSYMHTKGFAVSNRQAKENLELALITHNDSLIGTAYEDLATTYLNTPDKHEAIPLLNKALEYYSKAGVKQLQATYATLAKLYSIYDKQDMCLRSVLKATELAKKFNDHTYKATAIYEAAGVIYTYFERYPESIYYLRLSYQNAIKYINIEARVQTLLLLDNALRANGQMKEASQYIHEIEKYYQNCGPRLKTEAVTSILYSYLDEKNDSQIEKYHNILLPLFNKLPDDQKIPVYDCLIQYGFYKKNYNYSKKLLYKYRDATVNSGNGSADYMFYSTLARIDSAQGDYLASIKHNQMANKGLENGSSETENEQIANLLTAYNLTRKDKENLQLQQKASLQQQKIAQLNYNRKVNSGAILLLAVIAALLLYSYRLKRKSYKLLTAQKAEIDFKNKNLHVLLKDKELLMKEIHHRVKNNLQIVISLLNAQSHYLQDRSARLAIKNSQHRIQSMALIHKKLYQSDNLEKIEMPVYINELIEYLRKSFDTGQRIRFNADLDPIFLDVCQAVPLGLIINETVTNAIKYAFPENRTGLITIALKTSEQGTYVLSIEDDGIGLNKDFNINKVTSLGMKLIKGLSGDLDAKVDIQNIIGLCVRIEFSNDEKVTHLKDVSEDKLTA